jgi:LPXTG-site transpeptidase (sortase) family protein
MDTLVPLSSVENDQTKKKSRTSNRPALRRNKSNRRSWWWEIGIGTTCLLAILWLFIGICIQLVGGYADGVLHAQARSLSSSVDKPTAKIPLKTGLPVRLKIPSIKVNAVIRYVGIDSKGAMGVPQLPSETAWYMLGPKPGQEGSAVIAGHVNWWYGTTGVFQNLKKLKAGDKITVQDDRGVETTFVVRGTRNYGQKDDPTGVFVSSDGKAHLNLVTCAGVWDRLTQMYNKRLVVFADKVED